MRFCNTAFAALATFVAGVYAGQDLASTEIQTGFHLVIEYVTATDCPPTACQAHQHPTGQVSEPKEGCVFTYSTIIPQICSTGWRDMTYIISETATGTTRPLPTSGKPPLGFIVTTTECHVCGPTPTIVTITVPDRSSRAPGPNTTKSVISCTGGTYIPSMPTVYLPRPTAWSTPIGGDLSTSSHLPSSATPAPLSLLPTESLSLPSSSLQASSSQGPSSRVSGSSTSEAPPTSVSTTESSLGHSSSATSSDDHSTSEVLSETKVFSTELPVHTQACVPDFSLVGVSEDTFNPALAPFSLELSCGTMDPDNYTVLANWVPVIGTTATGSTIGVDSLDGFQLLTVVAFESSGWPIFRTFSLLFGSAPLSVLVVDEHGNPAAGATVYANASAYPGIGAVATSNAAGLAVFKNVPSTSISLRAVGTGGSVGVGSLAGGLLASVTVQLVAFYQPLPGSDGFSVNNGLSGWIGGSQVDDGLAKRRDNSIRNSPKSLSKRAVTLVVSTAVKPDLQMASKSFTLGDDETSVFIEYKFQTDEVPGGYFGTKYNDYYSVSMRTDTGASTFSSRSMNELGLGTFNKVTGETDWFSTQLDVSKDASAVEVVVAVSNVADSKLQSKVIVRRVGACDRCASCSSCSGLAKCRDSCKTPPLNSCAFYRSCAEETLRCGPAGHLLALGEQTCNKFQHLISKFSEAGKAFVPKAEQCIQQVLAKQLSCDTTCESAEQEGLLALVDCYAPSGFCSLKGVDYARIVSVLDGTSYGPYLLKAVSKAGCIDSIFDALDHDIKEKIAQAAAGTNAAQNVADVRAMVAARVFFSYVPKSKYIDAADAVKHVKQVYDTAIAFAAADPNVLVMDYYRLVDYNDIYWKTLVWPVFPPWIEYTSQHGVVFYEKFKDLASPPINVGFSHTFAAMLGVYVYGGRSLVSDLLGWLGDLYQLYGDAVKDGVSPGAYCQSHFGSSTLESGFKSEDLRQDADGYNIGLRVRSGAFDVATAFKVVMEGGYSSRIKTFFNARFDGKAAMAKDLCLDYMTTANPILVAARRRFAKYWIPPSSAVLGAFCDCFGNKLAAFAATG